MDRTLDEELQTHLSLLVEQNIERGMSPEAARRAAKLSLGGADQIKESVHDHRGLPLLETFVQDLRFALRMLRKSPGFTVVAVLTLALGIGANTAMFSVLYGLVLRPLPYADSSRLVMLWDSNRKTGAKHTPVVYGSFSILRSQAKGFEEMAAFGPMTSSRDDLFADRVWGTEERVAVSAVSPQIFSVLKVTPLLGRTFTASEGVRILQNDEWQFAHVAILSYSFWRQHYGANPDVIGKTLDLNGLGLRTQYTIVGVMPNGFDFPYPMDASKPDLWVNFAFANEFVSGNFPRLVGRLKPGVNLEQAQAEVNTIADRIREQYPKYYKDEYVSVVPLSTDMIRDVQSMLWVLLAAFAFILLIGCANVGNLLLVRAVSREKEMAVRATLGASRSALVRQMLAEGMLLAFAGGALGLLLAYGSLRGLVALLPQSIYIPRLDSVALDARILVFAALLSILAAGVFSVLPSLRLAQPNLNETMKSGSTRKSSPTRSVLRRPGSVLLVVEVSLALVLLTGALLMLRSMQRLVAVNSQFQPERLLSMEVNVDNAFWMSHQSGDEIRILFEQFEQRMAATPGVEAVALNDGLWLIPHSRGLQEFEADGGGGPIAEGFQPADLHIVTPGYLDMMDLRLLRGRWLADSDGNKSLPVAVINEAMAERYWPDRNPLGLKVQPKNRRTEGKIWYTIVGVVHEPKRFATGDAPQPAVYVPYSQIAVSTVTVIVRTAANSKGMAAAMRSAALHMAPGYMFVGQVQTGDELISESSAIPRFTSELLTAFSGLALLLALVGIYGLISYYTSRRTHEIGIRMALGAQRQDVMRLVLKESMLIVGLGVAIGVVAAGAFARTLESLLYGVAATDIDSFAASVAVLVIVALAACYIPARRAMKVDPMVALRYE